MTGRAPVLVLAVGNPSRGDDAIGSILAERLEALGLPHVEVITDFQLQVEHALDLEGRDRVVFVDAGTGTPAPFELRRVQAQADFLHTTHALSPEAVLATYEKVRGRVSAETWVLCVRGEAYELGEGLSPAAKAHLEAAWERLLELCRGPSRPV